jgi:hypothetical protein
MQLLKRQQKIQKDHTTGLYISINEHKYVTYIYTHAATIILAKKSLSVMHKIPMVHVEKRASTGCLLRILKLLVIHEPRTLSWKM